jgi:hypothetical protein
MKLPAHRFSCLLLPPEALLWLVVGGMLLWSANKNGVSQQARGVHVDTIVRFSKPNLNGLWYTVYAKLYV